MNDYPGYLIYRSQKHWGEKDLEVKKFMTLNKWLNSYLTASLYLLYQMGHKALTFPLNIYICPWILGLPTSWLHSLIYFPSLISFLLGIHPPQGCPMIGFKSDPLQIFQWLPNDRLDCWCFQIQKGLSFRIRHFFYKVLMGQATPSYQSWLYSPAGKGAPSPLHSPSPLLTMCQVHRELSQPRGYICQLNGNPDVISSFPRKLGIRHRTEVTDATWRFAGSKMVRSEF